MRSVACWCAWKRWAQKQPPTHAFVDNVHPGNLSPHVRCWHQVNPFDESLKNEYNVVVGGSIGHASEDVAAWQVTRQHEGSTGGAESGSAAIPTDRPMSKAERKRMRKKAWKLANPMSRKQRRRQKEAREKKFQEERCAREAQAGVASRGTGSVGESGGAATAQTAPKGEADV